MALSEEDRKQIVELLRGNCRCGLSPETQDEVGHFFGRLKDLGGGNLNVGIECFSDAVATVASWRARGEKIGGALMVFLCLTIAGGALTIFALGIKSWWRTFK